MSSQVVPVRLDRKLLESIDLLVRFGIFNSRSEALRELIKLGLNRLEEYIEVIKAVEELFRIEEEEGDIPIKLPGALKQFLKERGRFN